MPGLTQGTVKMASNGTGTVSHVAAELFKMMAGVDMVHMPYRGTALALTDLIDGQAQVLFDNTASSIEHIGAGRVRTLAVSTARRAGALQGEERFTAMTDYAVEVQADFLERQAKAQPIAAIAELIWNGLDADATEITVDLEDDKLGGLRRIIVTDNGHGIPHDEAPILFRNLGGSWKKHGAQTKRLHRQLHGLEGRGRFKAFALGRAVDWKTIYARDGQLFRYEITILEHDIRRVSIGDETRIDDRAHPGVTAVVDDLKRNFVSLKPEHSAQEFSEIFAIYLKNYRDVAIIIGGERLDPATAIAKTWEIELTSIEDEDGNRLPVSLEVIEWRRQTKRALYL
jgi:Tripartite tricarboxylate transporter family receptor/Histidine kinase-, DNA gyrase B-, and HSP90-like ATPase